MFDEKKIKKENENKRNDNNVSEKDILDTENDSGNNIKEEKIIPEDTAEISKNVEEEKIKDDNKKINAEEAGEPVSNIKNLKMKLDNLEKEKENFHNQLLRLQADFINYRKRVNKERESIGFNVKKDLIINLLPVIDNFERALNSVQDSSAQNSDDEFKKGINMIYRQLINILAKEGVESISTEDELFDHNLHDAVMQVEDTEKESGVIVEELQKGYIMNDIVIRPAMVKVAL
jgi:molecular chaperone GrpE